MRILKYLILVSVILIAFAYWQGSRPKQDINWLAVKESVSEASPKEVIDFDLPLRTESSNLFRLSQFKGKPILLNFWASWCPPCIEEMPSFLQFANWATKHLDLKIIAVSVDESWKVVDDVFFTKGLWPKKTPFPFQLLLDPTGKGAAEKYEVSQFPETFFINRDFKIIRRWDGGQDWTSQEIARWFMEKTGVKKDSR